MKTLYFLYSFLLTGFALVAQAEQKDTHLPEANAHFAEGKYAEAEANYRVSKSKFPKKSTAAYNLGNTIYKINQPSEARNAYRDALKNATTRPEKHRAFHNLGNVYMKEKNYTAAVDAYKNALINNPSDDETRYNYALAKKYLKENPPKDDKKDDKKEDKKDDKKDQDKKDKEDNKPEQPKDDKKDEKNDGGNKDDKNHEKQQQPKPKPNNDISKQRVENLLDAVNNEERKVQEKVKARQVKGKPSRNEKDW